MFSLKKSIIAKILIILGSLIILLFAVAAYLFVQSDNRLINKIRTNNLKTAMSSLDDRQMIQLNSSKNEILSTTSMIAKNTSVFLLNYNVEELQESLKFDMKNKTIQAVEIWDNITDELFLLAFKKDNKIILSNTLDESFNQFIKIEETIYKVTGDEKLDIGKITLYYDDSIIKKKISKLKETTKENIKKFNLHIDQDQLDSNIKKAYVAFGLLIAILLIISLLVIKLVKTPLNKLKYGLKSFFDYLSDSDKQVNTISINTSDEFGQMADFVNDSITLSIKMNKDIANLMQLMDKNVITIETDVDGFLTYVSEAFCKISGYSKDELLDEKHNILRYQDMEPAIFEEIWKTIRSRNVWSGEVKNKRKDGSFYWVYSIISPKVTNDILSGFTAIRYDITDKKEVEDLTQNLELKIEERTLELETMHKHTRESIEYAALIQMAVVSQENDMKAYFKDSFVHWLPKDTVGGDIWLFSKLRHNDECLLFYIDCTGHGVAGAFVTMIVKAIEREIISKIKEDLNMDISPAWIMSYFNKTMKILLKQETKDSISNTGWDGGIIYYNKREKILKFAGAETSLFYVDRESELKTIKGNRYSVGYKRCDMEYEYKETVIPIYEGMKFYCTTDGYLDQNGGEKDFPFGKKRFMNIIKQNHTLPMKEQKNIFIDELSKYENMVKDNHKNDDITLLAFEIG